MLNLSFYSYFPKNSLNRFRQGNIFTVDLITLYNKGFPPYCIDVQAKVSVFI